MANYRYRGVWASNVSYVPLDLVTHSQKVWLCKQNTTGSTPAENEYWTLYFTVNQVAPASKTTSGIVTVGDNIDVTTDGKISVKTATATTGGVLTDAQAQKLESATANKGTVTGVTINGSAKSPDANGNVNVGLWLCY